MTWYDFFVKPGYDEDLSTLHLKYVMSMNLPSPMDAVRICHEEGLTFFETFITLREHDGVDFIDLPEKNRWYRVQTNVVGPTGIPGKEFI